MKTPKRKQTPLRSVSNGRAIQLRQYRVMRDLFMQRIEHWFCEWPGCNRRADDVHHMHGRIGRLLLQTEHWKAICRGHHNLVKQKPMLARSLGILAPLGQYNSTSRTR